jgi:hypothetical protein
MAHAFDPSGSKSPSRFLYAYNRAQYKEWHIHEFYSKICLHHIIYSRAGQLQPTCGPRDTFVESSEGRTCVYVHRKVGGRGIELNGTRYMQTSYAESTVE